jgi:hypothetical protein
MNNYPPLSTLPQTWNAQNYDWMNRSPDVVDRRNDPWWKWAQAAALYPSNLQLREMIRHPLTMPTDVPISARYPQQPIPPSTPLSREAGTDILDEAIRATRR